jgi:FkbM family methyltransferase
LIGKLLRYAKRYIPARLKSYIGGKVYRQVEPQGYLHQQSTFSQAGEDAILRFLFLDYPMKLSEVSYLDIGARHPTSGSNTFLFYSCGASGVCVDADKTAIPLIREYRPRDKVLHVGVSTSSGGDADFYYMESGGSTLSKEEAERRERLGGAKILGVLRVPMTDLNTLIQQNYETFPVFLSIDIEGLDLAVLKTLDFGKYPIPVICVETCTYSETHIRLKDNSISNFLLLKGYETYADTYINTIYVNKKWFYQI